MRIFIGTFYILHGLVHLLYMGHSLRWFELEKDFTWPKESRFLSGIFTPESSEIISGVMCAAAGASFILSGIFVLSDYSWQNIEIIIATSVSTILYVLFWDGKMHKWHTQGGIAIIINLIILTYTLI